MIAVQGPASLTEAGYVTTGPQSFGGVKTFNVSPIVTTFTARGALYASATKEVASTAAMTNMQVLQGVTGSDPVLTAAPAFTGLSIDASGATITLEQAAGASSHFKLIATSASQYKIQGTNVSGASTIDIDPLDTAASNACTFRFFRSTNTSGNVALQGFQGNASATFAFQLSGNTNLHSYVAAITNQLFAIGTTSPAAKFQVEGAVTAAAWGTSGKGIRVGAATYTDSSSSGTVTNCVVHSIAVPTLAASAATTYSFSSTLYIAGPPTSGTNVTQSAPYSLWVDSGNCRFDGVVTADDLIIGAVPSAAGLSIPSGYLVIRDYDGTNRISLQSSSGPVRVIGKCLIGATNYFTGGGTAQFEVIAGSSTTIGQIVQAAASQSVALTSWRASDGTTVLGDLDATATVLRLGVTDAFKMGVGSGNTIGTYAIVIGHSNTASNTTDSSLVIGKACTVSGDFGVSIGRITTAVGKSLAIGLYADATGTGGIAIGFASNTNRTSAPANTFCAGSPDNPVNDVYFGKGVISSPTPTAYTIHGTDADTSSNNIAGAALKIAPGRSRGNATPATVVIQGTVAGASGTSQQALVDCLTVNGTTATVNLTTDSTSSSTGAIVNSGGMVTTKNHLSLQGQGWGVTSTATAAGTTTLTSTSTVIQIFTGSTTQTIQFPAANLFGAGIAVIFIIINESSGDVTPTRAGSDTFVGGGSTFPVAGGATKKFMSNGVNKWSVQ